MALDPTLQQLSENLRPIFERYQIHKAIVFGSFARGEDTRRSDLDLILIQQTDKRFLDRYQGILYELGRAVGNRGIDLFIYTPQEFADLSGRAFIARVIREGKVIYERGQEST